MFGKFWWVSLLWSEVGDKMKGGYLFDCSDLFDSLASSFPIGLEFRYFLTVS